MMIISPVIIKYTIDDEASNIVSMDIETALEVIGLDTPNDLELNYAGRLIPPRASLASRSPSASLRTFGEA